MSRIDPRASRGYRNRNPGNIEHSPANKWLGLDDPPSDGRFCRFVSHEHGIREAGPMLGRLAEEVDGATEILDRGADEPDRAGGDGVDDRQRGLRPELPLEQHVELPEGEGHEEERLVGAAEPRVGRGELLHQAHQVAELCAGQRFTAQVAAAGEPADGLGQPRDGDVHVLARHRLGGEPERVLGLLDRPHDLSLTRAAGRCGGPAGVVDAVSGVAPPR